MAHRLGHGIGRIRGHYTKLGALTVAFVNAQIDFSLKHGREPNWDIATFKGCFTTSQVVLEISEEQSMEAD